MKLEILGGGPTLLMSYLDSILLMWFCSRKVIEVGFAQGLVVLSPVLNL
jgi:hypothetical protein